VVAAAAAAAAGGLSQEGAMWAALAEERRPEVWAAWARRAYATQVCLDAAAASIAKGGAVVEVEPFARGGEGGPAAWLWG
jgi:hypothetical protein